MGRKLKRFFLHDRSRRSHVEYVASERKGPLIWVIFIFIIWFLLALCWGYRVHHLEKEFYEIQQDVNTMNLHNQSATQSEYTQTIDFLENELAKYREFVEKQQEFLVWLVGLIGAGLTGLLALFEIKSRKDISNIIHEQYEKQVQEEITTFIGGQDKVNYLNSSIKKEEQAKKKKILFVLQRRKENERLEEAYEVLKDQQYDVTKERIVGQVKEETIEDWIQMYEIIIYQVDEREYKSVNSDPKVNYARISEKCNSESVYGILYCEKNYELNFELLDSKFYISSANLGTTLMERVLNLLYFL